MPVASQSATLNSIMEAVGTVLTFATGLDSSYVIESYDDERPTYEGESPYCVVYRLTEEDPFLHPGAGRKGAPTMLAIEVIVYVRLASDLAGSDAEWARNASRGMFVMRHAVVDALDGKFLFSAYNSGTGLASGQPLTIEPLQQLPSPKPEKDKTDRSKGETHLFFAIRSVKPLVN